MSLFTEPFLTALVLGAVTAGLPLLLAGLGEQMSERAGVLNVGIEGMMLAGAYGGFLVAYRSGSIPLGLFGGATCGGLVAALMALFCVRLALSQIVVGIALTLAAEGLTALLHHVQFSQTYPRLPAAATLPIPLLSAMPVVGPALFDRPLIVYLALACVPALSRLYRETHFGLALQAAGDAPAALDAAGVDVLRTRMAAVLATGVLAGTGGAFMAEIGAGLFVPFMTNGAGFIGIVLAMLARGRPLWVLWGALLFGMCLSLATALQVVGVDIPSDVIQMIPFAAVMAVLVAFGRRASLPAALGVPYRRGER
ncbi:putative B6 ABC transporter permease subunit 1 [Lichenifustis flavocetrariae]|uniref:ABC transporter permease n=1 Tax=Lichenifustis flavocetrariae TaxID=2949735 RepID=A0AA41Z6W3_9HYPH|nr:ABC transporter permease [Lichenifustis flavocetrariae]MCW6511603.1 ABC transporter permease [Lichenifustis flavocetrariae]